MSPIETQSIGLTKATFDFSSTHGKNIIERMEAESRLTLNWLHYLNTSQKTGIADELLDGAASSIREATACAALGMVRPSIFSIRMYIDLLLAWLYFKDHKIEWETLNTSGEGFKMKRDILEYLSENYTGFSRRLSLLKEVISRSTPDPYRLLSAHVHAQSTAVIPTGKNLADVVQAPTLALQCTEVWREVSEYVGDILVSKYALKWTALPQEVRTSIETRLGSKKNHKERFFEDI